MAREHHVKIAAGLLSILRHDANHLHTTIVVQENGHEVLRAIRDTNGIRAEFAEEGSADA